MKTGKTYRFSLQWAGDSEEQVMAGEYLELLGNKKSRLIIRLVCEYLSANPDTLNPKEAVQFILSSPSSGFLTEIVRSIIKTEFSAGTFTKAAIEGLLVNETGNEDESSIGTMFDNLDIWNSP